MDERCHRRHRMGHREPRQVQDSRDQSLARASGHRAVDHRSAVHRGHESDRCGNRRRRLRRKCGKGRRRHAHPRRYQLPRQFSVCDYRRCDEHERDGVALRRHHDDLQLARPDEVRARREAGRRRAGQQDRVARDSRIVPAAQLLTVPHGGKQQQRLHAPQRHEHVGGRGHRGRRAPDAGASEDLGGAGEDRAANGIDIHERRRIAGRRRRQREFLDDPQDGGERPDQSSLDRGRRCVDALPAAWCSGTRAA